LTKDLLAQQELKDFTYWANLCDLLKNEKKYTEALAACDQALALKPNEPIVWTNRIEALLKLKKYPEALASADSALAT
jgi:predicted Zn-dependent protease